MRFRSIQCFLENYEELIQLFQEAADSRHDEFGAKCSGFLNHLLSFKFFFALNVMKRTIGPAEEVNRSIQAEDLRLSSIHEKINVLKADLKSARDEEVFSTMWTQLEEQADNLGLSQPAVPRLRRPPQKLDAGLPSHSFRNLEEYYRSIYYPVLDSCYESITKRFDSEDFLNIESLERNIVTFLTGERGDLKLSLQDVTPFEGDVDLPRLELHLSMLKDVCRVRNLTVTSFNHLRDLFKSDESLRTILSEVMILVELFYTIPITTCTAERSFSALRRLKNYLRTTMTQKRLNHVALLHIHKVHTDSLDVKKLVNAFVGQNVRRGNTFAMS